jgi:PIN like domain
LEFHQGRLGVISEQHAVYRSLRDLLQRTQESAEKVLGGLRKDSVVNVENLRHAFRNGIGRIQRGIDSVESRHPLTLRQAVKSDPVLDEVSELFAGKTGRHHEAEQNEKLLQEAQQRINDKIPPGYADAGKNDGAMGDVVLWLELLEWASQQENPIILVTDDQKEDWYRKEGSTVVGPRPELVAEMRDRAGVEFYLYTFRNFLQYARTYLLADVSERTLDEVRDVREESQRREQLQRLQDLIAYRAALQEELAHDHTIRRELDAANVQTAMQQGRLEAVESEIAELQAGTDALSEQPADDGSDAAQAFRQRLEMLKSRKGDLELQARHLRADLDAQVHKRASIQHRLSSIESRVSERQVKLLRVDAQIAALQEDLAKSV